MTSRERAKIEPIVQARGSMQQAEIGPENDDHAEHAAREVGHRWGTRLKGEYLARTKSLGNWPGTLEEARRLVDSMVARKVGHDERELLALLVERGARRAWHARSG